MRPVLHSHYHILRMTEMKRVVWAHFLSSFGMSMVTIFVPIFLLKSGYSFSSVMLYMAELSLFAVPLQYVASKLTGTLRANHAMAIGLASKGVFLFLLLTLGSESWPLWLVAFFWAGWRAFYWVAFHINFSKTRDRKKEGSQVSGIAALKIMAGGAAPAIGGILATAYGIGVVYGVAIGLLVISIIPLLHGEEVSVKRPLQFALLRFRRILRDLFANVSNGVTTVAESFMWPILVSFLISTYAGIGILSSVVVLSAIAVSLYVGRRQVRRGRRHYIREGVAVTSASDILRLLAENASHVFGINLFGGVGNSLYYTPLMTKYYDHADEEPRLEYITAMEIAHEVGWGLFFLFAFALSFFLSPSAVLLVCIAIAAPFNFGIRAMR
ncbi:MAG: MFS transporter [Patescibacteria group bacterium]